MKNLSFSTHFGIDLTGEDTVRHFAALQNMRRRSVVSHEKAADMQDTPLSPEKTSDTLETTIGFRRLLTANAPVHTLIPHPSGKCLYMHAGRALYVLQMAALPRLTADEETLASRRESAAPAEKVSIRAVSPTLGACYLTDIFPERPLSFTALGDTLYIADGAHLFCLKDGALTLVSTPDAAIIDGCTVTSLTPPYVPLLRENGVPSEQRNLLTDEYREECLLSDAHLELVGNAPLTFEIVDPDEENPTCRVTGLLPYSGKLLQIPAATVIGGIACTVTEIAPYALSGGTFTELVLPHTMRKIGAVPITDSGTVDTVYIPLGVHEIYMSAFNGCAPSLTLHYEGKNTDWEQIALHEDTYIHEYTLRLISPFYDITCTYPLAEKTKSLISCTLDGVPLGTNRPTDRVHMHVLHESAANGAPYVRLLFMCRSRHELLGKRLSIRAKALPFSYGARDAQHPLYVDGMTGALLLTSSRQLCAYDSRLFFGGMEKKPDLLFYSHVNRDGLPEPTYIGTQNYQTDTERLPIFSMHSAYGDLLILRTDGTRAKVSVHRPTLPPEAKSLFARLYPEDCRFDVGALSAPAFTYDGRLHVMTTDGIFKLVRQQSTGYYDICPVASRIAPVLRERGQRISSVGMPTRQIFGTLDGCAALFLESSLYIGDSVRTERYHGRFEYEWYPVSDVVSYKNDERACRFADEIPYRLQGKWAKTEDGRYVSVSLCQQNAPVPLSAGITLPVCEMWSGEYRETGEDYLLYPTLEGGERVYYLLEEDCTRIGGDAYLPSAVCNVGARLFFGTEEGALCLFNTDEGRGDTELPYLFDGRRQQSLLSLFPIDCNLPNCEKKTVSGSSTCILDARAGSAPTIVCQTERGEVFRAPLPAAPFDFSTLDFSICAFSTEKTVALPLPDTRRPFREKTYTLFSDRPFAFVSLSFAYQTVGFLSIK